MNMSEGGQKKDDVVHYMVDDEPESTDEKFLTPVDIMREAGVDPESNYLVDITGNHEKSYKDEPQKKIHMKDGMKFVTRPIGPMPVS